MGGREVAAGAMPGGADAPAAQRRKSRSGATAMKHARAVLEHDGFTFITAGKRVIWKPGRGPIALPEDIFGCFDFFAIAPGLVSRLIQVTSETKARSSVAQRQRKIEAFIDRVAAHAQQPLAEQLEVWAWVNGRHFRRWVWLWQGLHWHELAPLGSPLLAPRREA